MGKDAVVYYSFQGNNRYLAQKVAEVMKADLYELKPRGKFFTLILTSLFGMGVKLTISPEWVGGYERVFLCGPIWMGRLISPLSTFIKKHQKSAQRWYFLTCCGSGDREKDGQFGYGRVFAQVERLLHGRLKHCQVFPISLSLSEDLRTDGEAVMNARLTDATWTGELEKRWQDFLKDLQSEKS